MLIARPLCITILLILVILVGCSDHHFSNTAGPTSESVVSNVQTKTLSSTNVQVTSNVTNPSNVIGGTGQLQTATGQSRRGQAAEVLGSVPITAQNLQGDVLTLVFTLNKPPGNLSLIFSIIDAAGHQSNGTPIVVPIKGPIVQPGPPPPLAPGTIVIKTLTSGSSVPPGQTLSGLNIVGAASYGPLTIPLNSSQTINNAPAGNYTASGAHAYFAACAAQGFSVPSGGTVTLTYVASKIGASLGCFVTATASPQFGTIVVNSTVGAGIPTTQPPLAGPLITGLTLTGPSVTYGPFSMFTVTITITNAPAGSYNASSATGYITAVCPATPFSVPAGGTVTLTYSQTKPPFVCTVTVS